MRPLLPFCPLMAGYSADIGDGTIRTPLDGGPGRYRADLSGSPHMVSALWRLRDERYSMFMGFVRNYRRNGAEAFEIDLRLDTHKTERYVANFIPGSVRLVSKEGRFYTVSATLEVQPMPDLQVGELDYWGSLIMMLTIYGSFAAAREILDLLGKLVNEDLPHA
ncbi:hypothetical protein [Achromobacter sp. Bel]|uniref:hypothetical protein n=1 Tax=Achromobacter sp. Bel TaxID=2727415 RepID=UPI00145DF4C5|nr:hypothetical protein [Achromobacter sp. Bel]NMK45518.1 hypothetical protein [Achromobacter sp. Bel]